MTRSCQALRMLFNSIDRIMPERGHDIMRSCQICLTSYHVLQSCNACRPRCLSDMSDPLIWCHTHHMDTSCSTCDQLKLYLIDARAWVCSHCMLEASACRQNPKGVGDSPPLLMTSLERSVICIKPCSSMVATSPVENQPSLSTAASSFCSSSSCASLLASSILSLFPQF